MNHSINSIVSAARRAIPDATEKHYDQRYLRKYTDMLLVGIAYEMATVKPSYPELGRAVDCSHSTAMRWLQAWRDMHWRDRYGWLLLVEQQLVGAREAA